MAERMLNNFLIGCDPEFAGISAAGGAVRFAHNLGDGEIGQDHGGYVAELHPTPHHGTYMLVKKLQRIIANMPAFAVAKLRAGAYIPGRPISLGGHVHIDLPSTPESRIQIQALDALTQNLEALDILPKDESEKRRSHGEYGFLGDVRWDKGRLEYRTMASWLDKPEIAMLCLTAAKLACVDPKSTLTMLGTSSLASFANLKKWFELYRPKDVNARRVVDRLFTMPQEALQATPGEEFRPNWRELAF